MASSLLRKYSFLHCLGPGDIINPHPLPFVCLWPHCTACRIWGPRPGIEPVPPALEAQNPSHWTTREVPIHTHFQRLLGLQLREWFSLNSFDLESSSDKVDRGGVGEFGASSLFGSDSKESACSVEDLGLIPGLGRSPGEENGNPLQYCCLENPMDRGVWIVHGVIKSRTRQSNWHFYFLDLNRITCGRSDFGRGRGSPVSTTGTMSHISGHVFPLLKTHPCFPVVVQSLCLTLCDPMDCSMPGILVLHYIPEFAQTRVHWVHDAIQPSHPLSHPSSSTLKLSQHQGLFHELICLHQVVKVLELQHQHQSFQWILASHSRLLWSGPCLSSVYLGLFSCTW